MTLPTSDHSGPQRYVRIAELLHCRQQIDAELAELCGTDLPTTDVFDRQLLERLMEIAPIGIAIVHGPEHRYTYVNPAYQAIPGTASTPMVGRTLAEVFPDLIAKGIITSMDQVYATGQSMAFHAFEADVGPGREQTYWDVDEVPHLDAQGQVESILILTREVTDQVQAEKALRESEQRLKRILDSSHDGYGEWDISAAKAFASARWCEITGLPDGDIATIAMHIHPDDAERIQAIADPILASSHSGDRYYQEYRFFHADGHEIWLSVKGVVTMRDAQGHAVQVCSTISDVTAQKQAEDASRESEARLRTLGDNLPEVALYRYRHTPDGTRHFEFISAGIEQITGVPPAEILQDAAALYGTILPEDLERLLAAEIMSRDHAALFEIEVRQRHRITGAIRWSLLRAMPTRYSDGATVWDGVQLDITQRKMAAKAQQESEARLAHAEDIANLGHWEWDLCTDTLHWSPGIYHLTGVLETEAPSFERIFSLIHPDEHETFRSALVRVAQGEAVPGFDLKIITVSGEERYIHLQGETIHDTDGQPFKIFGTLQDITERKHTEEERERLLAQVQRQAAELEATFTAIADGIIIYDAQGNIVQLNAEAQRLSGYSPEDAQRPAGERVALLNMSRKDGSVFPLDETPALRALRHGETVLGETMVLHLPDRTHWTSISAAPIRLDDATIHGAIATLTDITELHAIQEQMETFVQLVSHDLRAPLTVINGHMSMLKECLAENQHRRVQMSVDAIRRAARRMDVMIDDLVVTARLEGGQLRLTCTALNLSDWLPKFMEYSTTTLNVQRVRVDMPATMPIIKADADRLERILTNLLSNALKYSDPGTPVWVQVQLLAGEACIAVKDQGQGIAPQDVPHLFEKFFRAGSSRKAEGIGLGLYITKLMVESHSGRIWVESVVGKGSTFSFTLPVEQAAEI